MGIAKLYLCRNGHETIIQTLVNLIQGESSPSPEQPQKSHEITQNASIAEWVVEVEIYQSLLEYVEKSTKKRTENSANKLNYVQDETKDRVKHASESESIVHKPSKQNLYILSMTQIKQNVGFSFIDDKCLIKTKNLDTYKLTIKKLKNLWKFKQTVKIKGIQINVGEDSSYFVRLAKINLEGRSKDDDWCLIEVEYACVKNMNCCEIVIDEFVKQFITVKTKDDEKLKEIKHTTKAPSKLSEFGDLELAELYMNMFNQFNIVE